MKAEKLGSGNYRVRFSSGYKHIPQPDGSVKKVLQRVSITASTPDEAEFKALQYKRSVNSLKRVNILTLKDAMDCYIDYKSNVISPSTIKGYKWIANNCFHNLWFRKLIDITNYDVQFEINMYAADHSAKSVKNAYGFFSAVFDLYLPYVQFNVTLPRAEKKVIHVPTDAEIKQLVEAVKGTSLELAVYFAAFGSLRRSEVCALTDEDIDGNYIYVTKALVKNADGKYILKLPKTTSSTRRIEMPEFVIKRCEGIKGRLVPITPDYITRKFPEILKQHDLPHFRFHDLRHYQASILHALGIPDVYIMQRGGWKSRETLNNIYEHAMQDKAEIFTKKALSHFDELSENK